MAEQSQVIKINEDSLNNAFVKSK